MRPGWVLLILLALLPVAARNVLAAGGTGPLLLAKPLQWIDVTYQITGEQQSTTSLRQLVREEYNFKIDYALARPSLLRGTAAVKLITDQQFFSSGGSSSEGYNAGIGYNLGGALFGRSPAPGSFTISSNISEVSNSFARPYQL